MENKMLLLMTIAIAVMEDVQAQTHACGAIGTGTTLELTSTVQPQTLTSPGYTHDNFPTYPLNVDCAWKLMAPSASEQVCLTVSQLSTEYDPQCTLSDYFEIYDGAEVYFHRVYHKCGTVDASHLPKNVCSSNDHYLIVKLHSDESSNNGGFVLQFWTMSGNIPPGNTPAINNPMTTPNAGIHTQACGIIGSGTMLELMSTAHMQTLTSPGYEHATYPTYPLDSDCAWKLTAPTAGTQVCLTVQELRIEHSSRCATTDYFEIYDGADTTFHLLYQLCGTLDVHQLPKNVCSSNSNYLIVKLHSDSTVNYGGFLLNFWTTGHVVG